ncbi:MAG TPA: MFS transporter [Gemmatimonadales bacterium]|nr:MFS transporter [Gemmatimonadales bacterium]
MATNIHEAEKPSVSRVGVPPTVKGLSLVSLFNDFASEMVYPLLPAFITRTLGGGPLILGLLDGAAELTSSAVKWISGRLADRPGWPRPLILWGYAIAVLVRPLIAGAGAAWQVVGLRVADRIGKGVRTPPRDALIAQITSPLQRGRAFGFHRGADHFGAVLGSLAAWVLLTRGADIRSVIGWSVVPGVLAFVVLVVVLKGRGNGGTKERGNGGTKERGNEGMREAEGAFPRALVPSFLRSPVPAFPRSFWPPVVAITALTFFRLPEALLILRLQDRGVAVAVVPLVWAGLHVVRSASSYPGGWLVDRLGPRRVVAAGGLLFALVALVLGSSLGPAAAVALFLLLGLVAGLTESGERAVVARLAPARMGRGFGAYHALAGAAALPAGLIFGAIYQSVSGQAALWASAAGMGLAVVAWLIVSPVDQGSDS